jgi:ABC-type transport system involved in multi-copper enzyme maturation permease subunit
MKSAKRLPAFLATVAVAFSFFPPSLFACAVCFGQSNSAQAKGMTWGILSLGFVLICVLGAIASFFIYLARKGAVAPGVSPTEYMPPSSEKVS